MTARRAGEGSGSHPLTRHLVEPLADPAADPDAGRGWTSDLELDRLRVLTGALADWSGVYERWRHHPLAAAHPARQPFGDADRRAVDALRGIPFGPLTTQAARWAALADAAGRWVETCRVSRAGLAAAWRDDAGSAAVLALERVRRVAEDCAARCAHLGLHLDVAIGETAVPVVRETVAQLLARSRDVGCPDAWPSPQECHRRIAELEGATSAGPADHGVWRAELDGLAAGYDAVLGLLRADLRAAQEALAAIWQAASEGVGTTEVADTPAVPAAAGTPSVPGAPAATRPASAGLPSGPSSDAVSSGGSDATAGGGGVPGTGGAPAVAAGSSEWSAGSGERDAGAGTWEAGTARLGALPDAPSGPDGGARLASVAGDGTGAGCDSAAVGAASLATAGAGSAAPGTGSGAGSGPEQRRTGEPPPGGR